MTAATLFANEPPCKVCRFFRPTPLKPTADFYPKHISATVLCLSTMKNDFSCFEDRGEGSEV